MANKKKKSARSSSPVRSRTFTAELYPEWDNFAFILTQIRKYNYAYCLHDKDVKDDETGELKKAHVHVVMKFTGRRTLSSVKNEMMGYGVPDNLVNTCNERVMLRYLIHKDNPEKYQYPLSDIQTNMSDAVHDAMNDEITSDEAFRILNKYIMQSETHISQAEMNMYALDNGLLKGLKAYGSQLNGARIEHNKSLEVEDRVEIVEERYRALMEENASLSRKQTIDDVITVADATGFDVIEYNGKRYQIMEVEKKKPVVFDEEIEQIDMLKESRKR